MSFQAASGILRADSPIIVGWGKAAGTVQSLVNIDPDPAGGSRAYTYFDIYVWTGHETTDKPSDATFTLDLGNDSNAVDFIFDLAPFIQNYINTDLVDYDGRAVADSPTGNLINVYIDWKVVGEWNSGNSVDEIDFGTHQFMVANGYTEFKDGINSTNDSIFLHTPRTLILGHNTQYLLPVRGGTSRSIVITADGEDVSFTKVDTSTSEGEIFYVPLGKPNLQKLFFDSDNYTVSGGTTVNAATLNGSTEYELVKSGAFGKMDYALSGITGASKFSVLAKEGDSIDTAVMRFTVGGSNYSFIFDLTLIEVTQTNAGFDANIVDAGDGYRLITIEYTGSTTEISLRSDTAVTTGNIFYKDPYLDYGLADAKSVKVEVVNSETQEVIDEVTANYEECYYEEGHQIVFMNRFGAWDSIALLGRSKEFTSFEKESYMGLLANKSQNTFSYDTKQGSYRSFNQMARKKHTVNTGWTQEDNISAIQDINLSPAVLLLTNLADKNEMSVYQPLTTLYSPVIIEGNEVEKQTLKHEKNINYTLNLKEANHTNNRIF